MRNTTQASLVLVFLFVFLLRFSFLGTGGFFYYDEARYVWSEVMVSELLEGRLTNALTCPFMVQGRPLFTVCYTLPAYLQMTFHSYTWIQAFNLLILVLQFFFFVQVAKRFLPERAVPLAALMWACLINSHLYLRHFLPYDLSMVFLLWALWGASLGVKRPKGLMTLGLLLATAFLVYPGSYLFGLVVLLVLLSGQKDALKNLAVMSWLGLGFAAPLLLVEIWSRGVHRALAEGAVSLPQFPLHTYLQSLSVLSDTVTQGDLVGGYKFPFHYLWEVEGALGLLLLLGLGWTLIGFKRLVLHKPLTGLAVGLACTGGYLLLRLQMAQDMVLYGRLLKPFFVGLVLLGVWGLYTLKDSKWKTGLIALCVLVSVSHALSFAWGYTKLQYPIDAARFIRDGLSLSPFDQRVSYRAEIFPAQNHPQGIPGFGFTGQSIRINQPMGGPVISVNTFPLFPINEKHPFVPPSGYALAYKELYPLHFKPYQFEGNPRAERARLDQWQQNQTPLYMQVWLHRAWAQSENLALD